MNQAEEALKKANVIRCKRARLKERLRRGDTTLSEVFHAVPPWLETAKVFDFVRAVKGIGQTKAYEVFRRSHIDVTITFARMTPLRFAELISHTELQSGRSPVRQKRRRRKTALDHKLDRALRQIHVTCASRENLWSSEGITNLEAALDRVAAVLYEAESKVQ